MDDQPAHFKGKEAVEHVAEAQARGFVASTEIHGTELPGYLAAGADGAKETCVLMLMLYSFLHWSCNDPKELWLIFAIMGGAWTLWKFGRSAWLGWSRLERLHRLVDQEKWEIDHHRDQEREELEALYAAKGFEGKLLKDAVNVLMADGDRLLQVMVEEEMGLTLESLEHPLKQALGAAIGTGVTLGITLCGWLLFGPLGLMGSSFLILALASGIASYEIDNRVIPAIVWNLGIAVMTFGFVYFLMQFFFGPAV